VSYSSEYAMTADLLFLQVIAGYLQGIARIQMSAHQRAAHQIDD